MKITDAWKEFKRQRTVREEVKLIIGFANKYRKPTNKVNGVDKRLRTKSHECSFNFQYVKDTSKEDSRDFVSWNLQPSTEGDLKTYKLYITDSYIDIYSETYGESRLVFTRAEKDYVYNWFKELKQDEHNSSIHSAYDFIEHFQEIKQDD